MTNFYNCTSNFLVLISMAASLTLLTFASVITYYSLVEKSLGRFVDEKKAQQLKEKFLPLEGHAFVAGRTDKGVTALQQVCSFCKLLLSIKHILTYIASSYKSYLIFSECLKLPSSHLSALQQVF